ncbi:hypothetical protein [Amycolatopsis japonica]|uniref:hypothetical protein n=1 Tax=Amycolatopsis japonica TaxID=208439 RepID=UPI000A8B712F|nr:hypothetical protein [Amycolatopsis japonica]
MTEDVTFTGGRGLNRSGAGTRFGGDATKILNSREHHAALPIPPEKAKPQPAGKPAELGSMG